MRDLLPQVQKRKGAGSEQTLGSIRLLAEATVCQGQFEEAKEFLNIGFGLLDKVTAGYQEEELRPMRDVQRSVEERGQA